MNGILLSKITEYLQTLPISKAWLFGSYAKGVENDNSDIDLLVEYQENYRPGLFGISRIIQELEGITGKKIDLVEEGCLYPRIAKDVESHKIKIYERKNT